MLAELVQDQGTVMNVQFVPVVIIIVVTMDQTVDMKGVIQTHNVVIVRRLQEIVVIRINMIAHITLAQMGERQAVRHVIIRRNL